MTDTNGDDQSAQDTSGYTEELTEEITDTDQEDQLAADHSNTGNQSNMGFNLLNILSGTQKTKKKRESKKLSTAPETPEQPSEISENENSFTANVSFDAEEYEKNVQRQQELDNLEAKIYQSKKRMSARDFLSKPKTKAPSKSNPEDDIQIISEATHHENDAVALLENQAKHKRVTARDIFNTFAPKRKKNLKGTWSLKVCLKISPTKLAQLKKQDPLIVKGNTAQEGSNMLSALMRPPSKSKNVTLHLPKSFLKQINQMLSPFYTRASGPANASSAPSVFKMMMNSASNNENPKLTPIQKAKELYPLPLKRSQFHVCAEDTLVSTDLTLRELRPKPRMHNTLISNIPQNTLDSLISIKTPDALTKMLRISPTRTPLKITDKMAYIEGKAPLASKSNPHKRILEDFILSNKGDLDLIWPTRFAPPNLDSLLSEADTIYSMKKWISNSFAILKTQSTKTPRNIKIRDRQRKQRQREALGWQGFIVDDDDDGDETEEDIFVPVMILLGGQGSGKSAAVYAAMNALQGYVNEVNSGQNRSRRELYGPLKEFCTSQIINKNGDQSAFQKGIVLFEDCDVLFEQDKTFWTAVQDVINFSRRPIVLTVKTPEVIPRSIWEQAEEQDSIFALRKQSENCFRQYIWLCCFSLGFDLTDDILVEITDSCRTTDGLDIRKALTECQWLCSGPPTSEDEFFQVSSIEPIPANSPGEESDLEHYESIAEILSSSDVIAENTPSHMIQALQPNELLDHYIIDSSQNVRQKTMVHETNIGEYLENRLHQGQTVSASQKSFNEVRSTTLSFISSRTKKAPKFLQDQPFFRIATRSRSLEEEEDRIPTELQGLGSSSICYSMTKTPFTLEMAAFSRNWARYQQHLNEANVSSAYDPTAAFSRPLNWRNFNFSILDILQTLPHDS